MDHKGLIFRARELDLTKLPRIDSHLHTSWTDGEASVDAVYQAAVASGLATVLYSEHSRKTSVDWFSSFAAQVRELPSTPCKAYVGTEVKVESRAGEIDTVPAISEVCDFVMASVHRFIDSDGRTLQFEQTDPGAAIDLEFELTWAVLANPQVDILGHMFGMSYRRFKLVPPDDKIRSLIARAAEYGVAVEINSYYHPNPYQMIGWCRDFDAPITLGSNAHTLAEVGAVVRLLEQQARNA
jgi:histidinol phosphatase-like PHP family hydrolase